MPAGMLTIGALAQVAETAVGVLVIATGRGTLPSLRVIRGHRTAVDHGEIKLFVSIWGSWVYS